MATCITPLATGVTHVGSVVSHAAAGVTQIPAGVIHAAPGVSHVALVVMQSTTVVMHEEMAVSPIPAVVMQLPAVEAPDRTGVSHPTAAGTRGSGRLVPVPSGTTEHQSATLEGLQPLYQAVAHGCLAGLHQQTCADVYRDRILRGTGRDGFYSSKNLGAIGADLGAVACFFTTPWTTLAPNLTPTAQAWLLNEAANSLQALGRLTEAVETMRSSSSFLPLNSKSLSFDTIRRTVFPVVPKHSLFGRSSCSRSCGTSKAGSPCYNRRCSS